MDWGNERYVRLYTRDTVTWKLLCWEAKALLPLLLRKVDRAGVLDVGADGLLGVVAVVEMPEDMVSRGIDDLIRRGVVTNRDTLYVIPNFLEAQECPQTDRQRQRKAREMRRAGAVVTNRDASVTERDNTVTRGHAASHGVTPSLPSLADPSQANSRASRKRAAVDRTPDGFAEFNKCWQDAYVAHTGSRPTFGAKQGRLAKVLLSKHGIEECCKRIGLFFGREWWFLERSGPDLPTFVAHFDKLVLPKESPPDDVTLAAAKNWCEYLNAKARTSFVPEGAILTRVKQLLADGHTLRELRQVAWHRVALWGDREDMRDNLRPSTLLGPKFPQYLSEAKAEAARIGVGGEQQREVANG